MKHLKLQLTKVDSKFITLQQTYLKVLMGIAVLLIHISINSLI